MAKKRANGEGNIRKRKDGRWEGRYTAGHDPETGKPIYKNVLGRTQAEARAKLKQAIEEGFILDVLQNYTTYKTFYQINKEIEEDPKMQTASAKRQIARFVELHETNIAQRIEVIVEHFRTTVMQELGGQAKAMVITKSRESAVKYHQAFEDYIKTGRRQVLSSI